LQPGSLLKSRLDADGDGQLDAGAMYQDSISITNTHPKYAVTVLFRYFNDNCEDLLEFTVVVLCNQTLLFDPFNFVIPFTNGENSRSRMIGPSGAILQPIPTALWGSGRFVITAAACGATLDKDNDPDILFPKEFESLDGECNIEKDGTLDASNSLTQVLSGEVRNVGENKGIQLKYGTLLTKNLHVLNASQISFNYLIGHLTTAIPKGFISDAVCGMALMGSPGTWVSSTSRVLRP
jgi:hypothetical protein